MAAITKISELGSKICVDDENEHLVPALGNGTGVPGDMCGIDAANGRITGVQDGTDENFVGILKESPVTGTETAIVADVPCSLIVPKSGHRYRIRCLNTVDTQEAGYPLGFSATAYKMDTIGDAEIAVARLSIAKKEDNDTVAEVVWA